jgi:hypothetical protein
MNQITESSYFKFVKDNLSIIIIVPTLLGGIWQLLELARISVSFMRFFSVTQLIPDGILICFFLFLITCGYLIVFGRDSKDIKNLLNSNDYKDVSWPYITFNIVGLVCALGGFYAFYPAIVAFYKNRELSGFLFFSLPFFIVIVIMLMRSFLYLVHASKVFSKLKIGVKTRENLLLILLLLLFYFGLYSTIVFVKAFHQSFLLPENFKNLETLKHNVSPLNPYDTTYEILYFNDKYIFVQHDTINSSKQFIEVLKFDDFFNK